MPGPDALDDRPTLLDLEGTGAFVHRHVGPTEGEHAEMLATIGVTDMRELIDRTVPADIRDEEALGLPPPVGQQAAQEELRAMAAANRRLTSLIGLGYHDTITPPVIRRNVLENPGWYTAYTPYQPEISQGRLEALLNFQTMVIELTA
ncbi:MAG: glycine dehydrogenase (aminomethyl-transferring), partial [Acidimicrobiales bacterium]